MAQNPPALHVIVLGSGGGPHESNVTAFLVRSVAAGWSRGSMLAVDAGVHLAAITRLLAESCPLTPHISTPYVVQSGPFAGLTLPKSSPSANAAHIMQLLVETYLITHPHLDHISGFVINTAGLVGTRPKKLAGLPNTVRAFKDHIFNNIIWPNLTDENNGVGLITYLRMVEGGSPAVGVGEGRGYLEVCEGLLAKTFGVSHGHCVERPGRNSASSASTRFGSFDASSSFSMPRRDTLSGLSTFTSNPAAKSAPLLSQASALNGSLSGAVAAREREHYCVYDSCAYFIQDQDHQREILIFGDVEPDSLSLSPRNAIIWQEAAPKLVAGKLAAIFIECSYDDSQSNDRLFGHLKPFHIMEELNVLASEVEQARRQRGIESNKKRKRILTPDHVLAPRRNPHDVRVDRTLHDAAADDMEPVSPKTTKMASILPDGSAATAPPHLPSPTSELPLRGDESAPHSPSDQVGKRAGLLRGLQIIIIHVKDNLDDGPATGDVILEQLRGYESQAKLGCEFIMSKPGQSFYF